MDNNGRDLISWSAIDVVAALKSKTITPLECLDALEQRISDVNPSINALVTLCFDRARAHATELMLKPVSERGLLAGLPVPIKDLTDVVGVQSTQGSPIFAHKIATESDILVRHLECEGGVIYAMSNTPEFGAGAHTFNEVFGVTRNPWNLNLSAAGSSDRVPRISSVAPIPLQYGGCHPSRRLHPRHGCAWRLLRP